LLRISCDLANDEVILHLEGEVTQPWTDELERMVTALFSDGKRVVLEMSAVRFMDAHAVDIVNMWSQSVVLSNCTPFLKELLKVRTLRREWPDRVDYSEGDPQLRMLDGLPTGSATVSWRAKPSAICGASGKLASLESEA
jgi:hypothetical protein